MPVSWTFERIVTPLTLRRGDAKSVEVRLRNRADRFGSAHVELYLERPGTSERWMVGSVQVSAEGGQSVIAAIPLDWRTFADEDGRPPQPGAFRLSAGFAGEALGLHAAIAIEG